MKELIVASNPARRKKRRTAKQKAATRKMIAANRRGTTTRRRPKRRPASRRRPPQRRRAAARGKRVARRRNPGFKLPRMAGIIDRQIMPALMGGMGAVGNDVLYNFIPFPPMFSVGPMRHVGKAASAIGLAWVSSFFLNKRTADQLGAGALTVVGYNVVRELVQRFAPQIQMGEYLQLGYYGAGLDPNMGEYLQPGMAVVPGSGVGVPPQLAQGSPYLNGLGTTWPTQYEEETAGAYDYET